MNSLSRVFICVVFASLSLHGKWLQEREASQFDIHQLLGKPANVLNDKERAFLWNRSSEMRKELCQKIAEWEEAGNITVIETRKKFLICRGDGLGMELDNFFQVLNQEMTFDQKLELGLESKVEMANTSKLMVIKSTQVY